MRKKVNKEDVIAVGMELIATNGYNATGIDIILKTAGVPKGSFYHYFGTKEDFGLAVIDQFATQYARKLDVFFADSSAPPLERIRRYLESSLRHLTEQQFAKGCLIGNLGQEMADQNERFRARLEVIFAQWKERFADCLREAQSQGDLGADADPQALADFLLAGWEGAILQSKMTRSPQSLRIFIDLLFGKVFT